MANPPTPYAILDGRLLPASEAGFPVHHQSLVDSLGIYETVLVEGGRFFHLAWHLQRLVESAEILGIELSATLQEIDRWARRLAGTMKIGGGLMRVVVYGSDGVWPAVCALYVKPMIHWPAASYEKGVLVTTSPGERFLPLAKSTNCLAQAQARVHARRSGAVEGLIFNRDGHLTEGSASNLLAVKEGALLRPLHGTALEGITETIAMRLAHKLGIKVVRVKLPLEQIDTWDEAIITSTTRRIMPIRQVDDAELPPAPGPVTQRLMKAFRRYEAKFGWGT